MNRIKELRKQKQETQEELGKILNLSKATISKYESGDLDLSSDLLIKLSEHFNVSVDYILNNTKNKSKLDERAKHLYMASSSDIDLAKLAELDEEKRKNITDMTNKMINMFYEQFGNDKKK